MGRSVRVYFFSAIHTCFSSKRQFWAGPVLSGTGAVVLEGALSTRSEVPVGAALELARSD
jgi:hypothetical protein